MMPYFYSAGHWNYFRDGLIYLRTIEHLSDTLLEKFLVGEHVIHLQKGFWNGVWSNMAIESTYMKTGKGPRGMIGTTTNERSTTIWTSGHHLCGELTTELDDLRSKRRSDKVELHKEEQIGRIQADGLDRDKSVAL